MPRVEMTEVYKLILKEEFKAQSKNKLEGRKQLIQQINQLDNTLSKGRNLLLNEVIDAADYRLIKMKLKKKLKD